MMVAPGLVCGVLLWNAAGRARQSRLARLGLAPPQIVAHVMRAEATGDPYSGLATTEWLGPATTEELRPALSAGEQLHLLLRQVPPGLHVRTVNAGAALEISRRVGSMAGWAIAILALSLAALGLIGVGISAWHFGSLLAAGLAAAGVAAILATLCTTLWIVRRFAIRPVSAGLAAVAERRVRRPIWFGSEVLLMDGQRLVCRPVGAKAGARDVPWNEVWDIKEGDRNRGLEIATLRLPIRFGAGTSEPVRGWLTRVVRLWKQAAAAPAGEQSAAEHSVLRPGVPIGRMAVPAPLSVRMAACGAVLFPLLTAVRLALQPFCPPAFPPGSTYLVLQWGLDTSGAIVSVVSSGLLAIGVVRLRRLERSAVPLIRAGFWLRVGLLAFLYFTIVSLQAAGVKMTHDTSQGLTEVAPAVSIETFLSAISNLAAIALVCWIETRGARLPLEGD
jgi:hypothetical protein